MTQGTSSDALLLLRHAARRRRYRPGARPAAAAGGVRAGAPAWPYAAAGQGRQLSGVGARPWRRSPGCDRGRPERARCRTAVCLRGTALPHRVLESEGSGDADDGVGVRARGRALPACRWFVGSGALAAQRQAAVRGTAEARLQRAPGVFHAVTWIAEQ